MLPWVVEKMQWDNGLQDLMWCLAQSRQSSNVSVITSRGTLRPTFTQLELFALSVYQLLICVHESEQSSCKISACDLVFIEEPQVKDFFCQATHNGLESANYTRSLNSDWNRKEVQLGAHFLNPGNRGDSRLTKEDSMAPARGWDKIVKRFLSWAMIRCFRKAFGSWRVLFHPIPIIRTAFSSTLPRLPILLCVHGQVSHCKLLWGQRPGLVSCVSPISNT